MRTPLRTLLAFVSVMALSASAQAATIVVDEVGTANSYGRTSGIIIDFNTSTTQVVWDTDLVDGQLYSVDSVSLYLNNWDPAGSYYLGVYTDMTTDAAGGGQDDSLSGFLGVSDNALALSTLDGGSKDLVTWNFSGINVTADAAPGTGSGVLYFVLQTGTTALAETGSRPSAGTQSFHRLDGTQTFSDYLSNTIEASFNGNDNQFDSPDNRPLEFQASVTLIPEPASLALMGLGGLLMISRRRTA